MVAFNKLIITSNSTLADFLCNSHAVCLGKLYVSARIMNIQAFYVPCKSQVYIALSLFVTDKATTMTSNFKGVLAAKLHFYWSILLFKMD